MVFNISSVPGSILYAAFFILKHHPYNVYYYIRIKLKYQSINEQIQNIAQKKDTLCRRMYN